MANIDIQWSGLDELGAVMQRALNQSRVQVGQVIYNNTEEMASKARAFAPVDTAFLRENITARKASELSGEVKSGAGYAGFQEWGTRYQLGTPHIRPAFDAQIPTLESQTRDIARGLFK